MADITIEQRIVIEDGHKVIYETKVDKRGNTYRLKIVSGDQNLMDIVERIIKDHFMNELTL